MGFVDFYDLCNDLLIYLKELSLNVLDFVTSDILGRPLLFWLFGAGLITFLTFKLIQALTGIGS